MWASTASVCCESTSCTCYSRTKTLVNRSWWTWFPCPDRFWSRWTDKPPSWAPSCWRRYCLPACLLLVACLRVAAATACSEPLADQQTQTLNLVSFFCGTPNPSFTRFRNPSISSPLPPQHQPQETLYPCNLLGLQRRNSSILVTFWSSQIEILSMLLGLCVWIQGQKKMLNLSNNRALFLLSYAWEFLQLEPLSHTDAALELLVKRTLQSLPFSLVVTPLYLTGLLLVFYDGTLQWKSDFGPRNLSYPALA